MTQPADTIKRSFAYVYDALYADAGFVRAQLDFLQAVFGPPRGILLDVGCGTGTHIAGLSQLGYPTVGTDIDPRMLRMARRKAPEARLARANMCALPFRHAKDGLFSGALCLESPLACLMGSEALGEALLCIRETLHEGATLVIDVYDYPGALGIRPVRAEARFESDQLRVTVVESHQYRPKHRIWTMRQRFEVEEVGESFGFEVVHRLCIRDMDEYAEALEAAGFSIEEALTAYPNTPERLRGERRIILVARRAA